ncbi:hypothetical protein [Synoicihabitans lomoniglobus]|nr:hypothetical protein [Opitutaceae bacterium LMO-M01]
MKMRFFTCLWLVLGGVPILNAAEDRGELLLVIGAAGESSYAEVFQATADAWIEAAAAADLSLTTVGSAAGENSRDEMQTWIASRLEPDDRPIWIVFVGHGSFDGSTARMNLPGPDVSATEMSTWLSPVQRSLVFVHSGAASAPFVDALSGPNRIIVAATESGNEVNFARFGRHFADAITSPDADIDQDGQTSVLEAFVTASQEVQAFYAESGRLATEHAIIDDNGDRRGTPYDFFNGTRLAKTPTDPTAVPDGTRARLLSLVPSAAELALTPDQRARRDALETKVTRLRAQKTILTEDDYYARLEALFRQLAAVYREPSAESDDRAQTK